MLQADAKGICGGAQSNIVYSRAVVDSSLYRANIERFPVGEGLAPPVVPMKFNIAFIRGVEDVAPYRKLRIFEMHE